MNSIIEYQLQRAATAGATSIGKAVNVKMVINRILDSLQKVYRDRQIKVTTEIDHRLIFKGDEGDLMEVLGNLLENAFKYGNSLINISAMSAGKQLQLVIVDDGPGVASDKINKIIQRGVRADQTASGHGIGLSIVKNIVHAYNGSLQIESNKTKGTTVRVTL
jgi:two-component system sensor histidine kinase PhoQ